MVEAQTSSGPTGDINKYKAMIDKEVLPYINLQLAFTLGFVSPLVPILINKTGVGTIAANFSGISSTGKTTSLELMASIWGKGTVSNNGIIKSFYSTSYALVNNLNNMIGFPVYFDDYEAGNLDHRSFANLIYAIVAGESKGQGNGEGGNRPSSRWETFVALSGETSIFERITKKVGTLHRILEFHDFAWTASKDNAEAIKTTCCNNYGFYGPKFVEGLAKLGKDAIYATFDESYKLITEKLSYSNGVEAQIINKLAYIITTAKLVRKVLDIDLKIDDIVDLLVGSEVKKRQSGDIYDEALEYIKELINENNAYIVRESDSSSGKVIGKVKYDYKLKKTVIAVSKRFIDESLIKGGFNDRTKIMKTLADRGYIDRDEDKLAKKTKLGCLRQYAYRFTFSIDDTFDESKQNRMIVNPVPAPEMNVCYEDSEATEAIFR